MAGFVHHTHNGGRANNNYMYMDQEATPYYGYGFYYNNPGLQNIDDQGLTPQYYGVFNGLGVSVNNYFQPVQHQMHNNRPNSVNRTNGSGTLVQVGPNPYYMHRENQTIQGDVVQRGTFNGRGMGARLHGHFSVFGDIN